MPNKKKMGAGQSNVELEIEKEKSEKHEKNFRTFLLESIKKDEEIDRLQEENRELNEGK